ncbi:MAG: TolC family protein [Aquificae bacterium]|nr:TolC family protein [Aquificota bacterium]
MGAFLVFLLLSFTALGLSLDEAINLAVEKHPLIKQEKAFLQYQKYDYYTTFGNFFPAFGVNYTYSRYNRIEPEDYFSRGVSFRFDWTVYNSGQNIILNRVKKALYRSKQFGFQETVLDLVFQVKKTYYQVCADREIVKVRQTQLKAAETIYKMAEKKLKLGLVTKADYLQAKVRYETVRYQLETAVNNYKKSVAQLNSLIGMPLDWETEVEEGLLDRIGKERLIPFQQIEKLAFKRPVFNQYRKELKAAQLQVLQTKLSYTPSVFMSFSLNRDYNSLYRTKDSYTITRIGLSWTIFDGLQRYYSYLASKEKTRYYRHQIRELERQIKLNLYRYYLDLQSAYRNLQVARTLLQEAEQNYKQALGEYRVGKGDIISLVSAESSLAGARETLVQSLLTIALTKAMLEREIGVKHLPQEGN